MAHLYEKKSFKKTSLFVVFDAGSLYETEGQYGTMHLMEHTICKTFDDMLDEFTKNGIAYNAYTSDDHVVFYFTGLASRLTSDVKSRVVHKILGGLDNITEESFNTERQTVVQEYLDYFNSESGSGLNMMRTKFGTYGAIGKRSDIEAFTFKDAKKRYKEFFLTPARIVEIGPEKTDFSWVKFADTPTHSATKLKYKKNWKLELEKTPESDKDTVVMLGKKMVSKADFPYMHFACSMLSAGLNSPFYKEIREKRGLSYYSAGDCESYGQLSVVSFAATTTQDRTEELKTLYNELFTDVTKYLTQERFDLIMSLAEVEKEEIKLLRFAHNGDLVRKGLPMMPKNPRKITYDKVLSVAQKYLNLDNLEQVVIK